MAVSGRARSLCVDCFVTPSAVFQERLCCCKTKKTRTSLAGPYEFVCNTLSSVVGTVCAVSPLLYCTVQYSTERSTVLPYDCTAGVAYYGVQYSLYIQYSRNRKRALCATRTTKCTERVSESRRRATVNNGQHHYAHRAVR